MPIIRSAVILATCFAIGAIHPSRVPDPADVAYPEGFRLWVHIRTGFRHRDSSGVKLLEGIHNIYANAAAVKGYASGHFPQGSVIAFELINVTTTNGTHSSGARRLVDVMAKDTVSYASTGGWGYDEFRGDTRERNEVVRGTCVRCHATQRERDYVFTEFKP